MVLKSKYAKLGVISIVVYLVVIAVVVASIVRQNGLFIYALDDPYIHLNIAKNWVEKGIWSANNIGFTSTTSSPLWTLLLVGMFSLFGAHDLAALILTILSGIFLIVVVTWVAQTQRAGVLVTAACILAVSALAPLVFLTVSGMEHVLHAALTILFVFVFAQKLNKASLEIKEIVPLFVLAAILVSVRLEGGFLVISAIGILLFRRHFLYATILAIAGGLPVAISGGIAVYHGWNILPNSILIKTVAYEGGSILADLTELINNQFVLVHGVAVLLVLVAINLFFLNKVRGGSSVTKHLEIPTKLFLAMSVLHVCFARIDYRYEAYLVAFGVVIFSLHLGSPAVTKYLKSVEQRFPQGILAILGFALCLGLVAPRATSGITFAARGAENIYHQHYQLALFFGSHYLNSTVGLNDIGAVGYFTNTKIVDLWGLADHEVGQLRIDGIYTQEALLRIAEERQIAAIAIFEDWFLPGEGNYKWSASTGLPSNWIKAGTWAIQYNAVSGGRTISFFGRNEDVALELSAKLNNFSDRLPDDVEYGFYN